MWKKIKKVGLAFAIGYVTGLISSEVYRAIRLSGNNSTDLGTLRDGATDAARANLDSYTDAERTSNGHTDAIRNSREHFADGGNSVKGALSNLNKLEELIGKLPVKGE